MNQKLRQIILIVPNSLYSILLAHMHRLIRCKQGVWLVSIMTMILTMGLRPMDHHNASHHWIKNCHKQIAISEHDLPFAHHCALLQQHHRNSFIPLRARGQCDPFSEMTMIKSLGNIRSGTL